MSKYHTTVLLQIAVDALQIKLGRKYIDATLGGGGHTGLIVEKGGIVLGIDQDTDALEEVRLKSKKEGWEDKLTAVQGNFANIGGIARSHGFERVSGILFDIGVSGHQFDRAERGFSFAKEGPLDMRMDVSLRVTAADLVNGLTKGELIALLKKYAEEPFAKKIAEVIVKRREERVFETTGDLAETIARSVPKIGKIHPATRVFQALRIAVNDELNSLENALPQSVELLEKGGRLVVIDFHSLEDRIVKKMFEQFEKEGLGKVITEKPIVPTEEEIAENSKARSAKMRVFEKI